MISYAQTYLNLSTEDYKVIFWKLFNSPDASKWSNVLTVVELLFCLPLANGSLERMFSKLKVIKTDRRSCLGEDTLDQLLRINIEGPAPSHWDAAPAMQLWWSEKIEGPLLMLLLQGHPLLLCQR